MQHGCQQLLWKAADHWMLVPASATLARPSAFSRILALLRMHDVQGCCTVWAGIMQSTLLSVLVWSCCHARARTLSISVHPGMH